MKTSLFLLISIFITLSHASSTKTILDLSFDHKNIGKSTLSYEDKSAKMNFTQIKNLPDNKFIQLKKSVDTQLFTRSAFWYKFDVNNNQKAPLKRLIVITVPWIDTINIYVEDKNTQLSAYKGGDSLPFENRTIKHTFVNFEHEFAPGSSKVYIQVKTKDPFIVPISILKSLTFLEDEVVHSNYTGFIYGIIIAMLLYNLVLFLNLKARFYAFYVLYLSIFLAMHASYNCYTFKWLFFNNPELQNWAESTTIFLFSIAGLLFAQSFLNLKKHFPALNLTTNYLIVFYISTMLITSLLGYHYHVMFAIGLTVIFSLYVFSIALYSFINGNSYARFFLFGTTAGLIGTSITALTVMAILPYSDTGFHAVDYGTVIDTVMLSLALADRMKIIQNEKLSAENETKKAIEAKKAKDEFLSNMSHEIRTPMNAILGFVKILRKNIRDKENLSYLNIIYTSSQTLLHVINDILDLSKIESGKLKINKYSFNPYHELGYISKFFALNAQEKSIELISHIEENVPLSLEGDLVRIRQIIFNFISNAFKFTPDNKKIYINVKYQYGTLLISVVDEGIGISIEDQKKIFNAFEQADNSSTRKYGGTGLGLFISHKLAKLMSGEITLKSKNGEGSTFTISLPVAESKSDNITISTEEKNHSETDDKTMKLSGDILIAEDNKTNQLLVKLLLDEYGLKYTVANDGLESVDIYKSSSFDLILMDDHMPNMSGVEAFKEIRDYEKKSGLNPTPVVALTANVMEDDIKRFSEAGMDDFLAKPLDNSELYRVLKRFCKT